MSDRKTTAQIEAEELWIRTKIDEFIKKFGVTTVEAKDTYGVTHNRMKGSN